MIPHELEIIIAPDGTVTATTKGAKGHDCLKYAELLQRIVGRIAHQELTAEFYEASATADASAQLHTGIDPNLR